MLVIETIIMLSLPRHMPINPSKKMLYMYVVYFENKAMAGDHIKVEWFLTTVKNHGLLDLGFRLKWSTLDTDIHVLVCELYSSTKSYSKGLFHFVLDYGVYDACPWI